MKPYIFLFVLFCIFSCNDNLTNPSPTQAYLDSLDFYDSIDVNVNISENLKPFAYEILFRIWNINRVYKSWLDTICIDTIHRDSLHCYVEPFNNDSIVEYRFVKSDLDTGLIKNYRIFYRRNHYNIGYEYYGKSLSMYITNKSGYYFCNIEVYPSQTINKNIISIYMYYDNLLNIQVKLNGDTIKNTL